MDKYFDGELLSGFEESPKTTTGRYEQLGYCEYRDVKTGFIASNYVEVMNEQATKIADLEAKLAKSEKQGIRDFYLKRYEKKLKEYDKENNQLKQQLADTQNEKDKIEEEKQNLSQCIEELKQQLAEKDAEVQSWRDGTMVVKLGKLEEQLAEKEKEIEEVKKYGDIDHFHSLLEEQRKEKVIFMNKCEELLQSQNQTAIEELEKVKELIKEHYNKQFPDFPLGVTEQIHIGIIDQQIRVLKGEN